MFVVSRPVLTRRRFRGRMELASLLCDAEEVRWDGREDALLSVIVTAKSAGAACA